MLRVPRDVLPAGVGLALMENRRFPDGGALATYKPRRGSPASYIKKCSRQDVAGGTARPTSPRTAKMGG